ncbi:UDP-N-acetylmuramoyl-tripeptide--D-alanyl-D-alanine ligase [Patescibacteria group bacterium]|nr:UDP-N-acetylmuramoyl-tripeptide--D-alanyl-D-alanine ligase [Patescibacteria group bacterium]
MKNLIKNLIQHVLTGLAKVWLKRKSPKIIGIMGSVGKTSIKEAVYTVLSKKFEVKKSAGNYNTEFGVPLSILGLESGNSSPALWLKVLARAFYLAFFDLTRTDILILEMGIDKPGDMDVLLKIVKVDVGILANVKPIHLAEGQFVSLDAIFDEKSKMLKSLSQFSVAILNIDDVRVKRLATSLGCKVMTYSTVDGDAAFTAKEIELVDSGLKFHVYHGGQRALAQLPILGEYHVYVLLPAIACGVATGMSLDETVSALQEFDLPPGRMNVLAGVNNSILIDSSYNSSPDAAFEALKVLKEIGEKAHRKIAVLGNMNELGDFTEREHRRIGKKVPECCDILIAVGDYTKYICDEARTSGMAENQVRWFKDVFEAKEFLKDKIEQGDILLVKGSQNKVRLEILVKELMRDKDKAGELLVRQGKEWEEVW